jgi:hypothetical protein
MAVKVRKMHPTSQRELEDMVQHVWSTIDQKLIDSFVLDLPKRIKRVALFNGEEYKL